MPECDGSKICKIYWYTPVVAVSVIFLIMTLLILFRHETTIKPFDLPTVNGTSISIPGNKPSWINFWSATCAPCLKELPLLDRLHDEYADRVNIVAIAVPYDPPNITVDIHTRFHLNLPLALDINASARRQFADNMPVPCHYLIDSKGKILFSHQGEMTEEAIRKAIAQHL